MISRAYFQDELRFTPWETERAELMYNIAVEISKNEAVKLILKGGTGLMLCYRLARFSSDLDYDGTQRDFNIIQNIRKGSEKSGREIEGVSLKKDTDTVKRYMVHYKGWENKPLKIEISLRNGDAIDSNSYREINGIRVYKVENLILQKIDAFNKRYKARDIYDLAFMAHYYGEKIPKGAAKKICDRMDSLGLAYMEKIMKEDEIIKKFDCEGILLRFDDDMKRIRTRNEHKESRDAGQGM